MPAFRNLKGPGVISIGYNQWDTVPRTRVSHHDNLIHAPISRSSSSTPPSSHLLDSSIFPSRGDVSEHIPRPRNSFIFFRSHYNRHSGGQDQNQVSISAGKAWKKLSPEEKRPFICMAEQEKREYQIKFPGYTYAPKSKAKKEKRKPSQKKSVTALANSHYTPCTSSASSTSSTPSECNNISLPVLPNFPPTFLEPNISSPFTALSSEPCSEITPDVAVAQPGTSENPSSSFVPTSAISPLALPAPSPNYHKMGQGWEDASLPSSCNLVLSGGSYATLPETSPSGTGMPNVVDDFLATAAWQLDGWASLSEPDPYSANFFPLDVFQTAPGSMCFDPNSFDAPLTLEEESCMQYLNFEANLLQ